jgi:hypothetical protein
MCDVPVTDYSPERLSGFPDPNPRFGARWLRTETMAWPPYGDRPGTVQWRVQWVVFPGRGPRRYGHSSQR